MAAQVIEISNKRITPLYLKPGHILETTFNFENAVGIAARMRRKRKNKNDVPVGKRFASAHPTGASVKRLIKRISILSFFASCDFLRLIQWPAFVFFALQSVRMFARREDFPKTPERGVHAASTSSDPPRE